MRHSFRRTGRSTLSATMQATSSRGWKALRYPRIVQSACSMTASDQPGLAPLSPLLEARIPCLRVEEWAGEDVDSPKNPSVRNAGCRCELLKPQHLRGAFGAAKSIDSNGQGEGFKSP